jgi:dTDP-4-dehydrorhamnose reductase
VALTVTGYKSNTARQLSVKKILIFGKDGQLGKAFRAAFTPLASTLENQPVIQYVGRAECDLSNESAITSLLNQFEPELIINASAYTAVDKAETEKDLAFAINARAPELMAQYAAQHGATFLHYSTDYVFDGQKYGFYLEDDIRNPLGVYGKSKAEGEETIVRAFAEANAVGTANGTNSLKNKTGQFAIFRTSWVYGDGGNFIRTILRLAKDKQELNVIEDQQGVPTSAQWLAQVSLDLVMKVDGQLNQFPSGIYHAVPAGQTNWHGLASLAVLTAKEAGTSLSLSPQAIKPIPAVQYPLPAPRPMNSLMSTDKLRKVFEGRGDMSKLAQLNEPWDVAVQAYVRNLVHGDNI